MKTIEEIQLEIDKRKTELFSQNRSFSTKRKDQKLEVLRVLKRYLETNPTKEQVERQYAFVCKELGVVDNHEMFTIWLRNNSKLVTSNKSARQIKNLYERTFKIKTLKFQKQNIEFLLNLIASPGFAKEMIFNFTPTYNISRDGKSIESSTFNLASDFDETL